MVADNVPLAMAGADEAATATVGSMRERAMARNLNEKYTMAKQGGD